MVIIYAIDCVDNRVKFYSVFIFAKVLLKTEIEEDLVEAMMF